MRTKVETLLGTDKGKDIEEAAHETSSWIQDAVSDVAGTSESMAKFIHVGDSKRLKQIEQAKKDGVVDIPGWLADEIYNDEDTLSDLMGDHIFDHATALVGIKDPAFSACFIKICEAMLPRVHTAMANVLNRFITEKKKRI